jgi:hypothetical protein
LSCSWTLAALPNRFPIVEDPPTQAEVQAIADKLDELINALSA